jgi:ferredoxin
MKIRIDADVCAGHGRCYETAPDLITDDEAGHGVVRDPTADVSDALVAQARTAARVCPERAVVLVD